MNIGGISSEQVQRVFQRKAAQQSPHSAPPPK